MGTWWMILQTFDIHLRGVSTETPLRTIIELLPDLAQTYERKLIELFKNNNTIMHNNWLK